MRNDLKELHKKLIFSAQRIKNNASKKSDYWTGAHEMLLEVAKEVEDMIKADLINKNISRCFDYKCELGNICKRRLQLEIDREKGELNVPVADFQGSEKEGLCEHFLNID